MQKQNLAGKTFNKLFVIEVSHKIKTMTYWKCQCHCGSIPKNILGWHLTSGKTQSCGCIQRQTRKTHGMHKTKTYKTWEGMLSRCNNINNTGYSNYGGRGIKVCERWLKFENFYEDMGDRPVGKTIDRINNNKGYYKKNCKWSSKKQQENNKTTNRYIEYENSIKTATEWAELKNISRQRIYRGLRLGYSLDKIFNKL